MVGDLIETVRPLLSVRARTFENYACALRKIAREAKGHRDLSKKRFDPKTRNWRRVSDQILLAKVTPDAVTDWKRKVISESKTNPVEQTRARRNVNSLVGSATRGRSAGGSQYYRANETFERVTKWLRAHKVTSDKPLHTLRKEFGSIICEAADIHAASRQLRHTNLATTAAFYTDNRRRVALGLLLAHFVQLLPGLPTIP